MGACNGSNVLSGQMAQSGAKILSALGPIVVIEPSRQMQVMVRTMLTSQGCRSVRMFADTDAAMTAMLSEPPSLVIMEWEAGPQEGGAFLKLFRHRNMFPVCLVPLIVMFSEARKRWVERALRLGAQAVIVKPLSQVMLKNRIDWVASGSSNLTLHGQRYVVAGVEERLEVERGKQDQLRSAREYQSSQTAQIAAIQNNVDRIMALDILNLDY